MTTAIPRGSVSARVLRRIIAVLERLAAPPLPRELPSYEQLKEARERKTYFAASPHILAAGGRVDIIRIPR